MSLYVALPVGRIPASCLYAHIRDCSTAVATFEHKKMPQEQLTLQALNLRLA